MARGVDKVQLIGVTVLCLVVQGHTCALMVMPRSRSRSMESSTWACISRSDRRRKSGSDGPTGSTYRGRYCAIIEKLRMCFIEQESLKKVRVGYEGRIFTG